MPTMGSQRSASDLLDTGQFIARVMSLRKAKGWSLTDLGTASGVPTINLRRLNDGSRNRITLDEAAAISAALGYDLRELLSCDPIRLEV